MRKLQLIKSVWFLCNDSRVDGLVLPSELPPDYFTSGNFAIQAPELDASYSFLAIKNEIEIELTLERLRRNTFRVTYEGIGIFIFKAFKLRKGAGRYIGGLPELKQAHFYILEAVNNTFLDAMYLEHNFLLTGRSK